MTCFFIDKILNLLYKRYIRIKNFFFYLENFYIMKGAFTSTRAYYIKEQELFFSSIISKPIDIRWIRTGSPLGANKTGFNLKTFHFNIHESCFTMPCILKISSKFLFASGSSTFKKSQLTFHFFVTTNFEYFYCT